MKTFALFFLLISFSAAHAQQTPVAVPTSRKPAATTTNRTAAVHVLSESERRLIAIREAVYLIRPDAVDRCIRALANTYSTNRYDAATARHALARYRAEEAWLKHLPRTASEADLDRAEALIRAIRSAMLSNPLLDEDRIVYVRRLLGTHARGASPKDWGSISLNSHTHVTIRKTGWKSQIVELSDLRGTQKERIIRTFDGPPIRDLQLSCDARTVSYTGIDATNRFAVYELQLDAHAEPRCVSPTGYPDVDWFDGVAMPDGRYIMLSTASYQGLPCEGGSRPMAQVYQVDATHNKVRQLTFDQDSDYTPSFMQDGRVLYTRWEYCDLPHYYSRVLMTMNPDGTSQTLLWGSGSYFPSTLLQVRQIPESTKLVGIVSGHHNVPEIGRLVLLDPSRGTAYPFKPLLTGKEWGKENENIRIQTQRMPPEKTGMLQEIPGYGEWVEADVCDGQTDNQHERGRPYFVYPCPLSEAFFLVTARQKNGLWGLYLADVFDNITLIKEYSDSAILHPLLVKPRKQPRVIPDRIKPESKTATIHVADIYNGPGLAQVPRGTVKKLRIFSYHFCYMKSGGHDSVGRKGVESGWDIKRILGTVDIEDDGSVCFTAPANVNLAVQPLDSNGAALQIMRSWFVGMPGERVSCNGCHEDNRYAVPTRMTVADRKKPQTIQPWRGPARAFTFALDVWPSVQRYCSGCHTREHLRKMDTAENAYDAIQPYVRRPGPESELPIYPPMDWHVSTSPLFQMLRKGHHQVQPDAEFYDRMATWVDLNCPWRGTWDPPNWNGCDQAKRRTELTKAFANIDLDAEAEFATAKAQLTATNIVFIPPPLETINTQQIVTVKGFPLATEQAVAAQRAATPYTREIQLNPTQKLVFVRIPAGAFIMGGDPTRPADEQPRAAVQITKPFWMCTTEIRNKEYALFDPEHDSRYLDEHGKDHAVPGYIANHPDQPVIRVSWNQAQKFCAWFATTYGVQAKLPTEAQWEYAARAGTATPFFYGTSDTNFSPYANLADAALQNTYVSWDGGSKIHKRRPYKREMNYPLYDARFTDNWFVVDYVAQTEANPWGLYDMIGNVNEWTQSDYRPYPYTEKSETLNPATKKVARGGSWATRPCDAAASVRFAYEAWQGVAEVGFRIVIED